ncbi:autophagy-related protein 18a-like isoform X1 [Sesamum indicum]|uniref:Autophagy-related protein 18a-like isoform X1 n=1 Tax=Sesamum indicum TaxID=4182 RepID=A0A6I9ULX8_SESIN|nr:autophagy-related protein 18a-like isoform X1 [Sesamum indicum]
MQKIYVQDLTNLRLLHQIETEPNPKGLCEISLSGRMVLVCLGRDKGEVRVLHDEVSWIRLIKASDLDVTSVALLSNGRLLAAASTKGTLIRLFDILSVMLLQDMRRGSAFERTEIHSLSFCSDAEWLALTSNKGTVDVFSLNMDAIKEAKRNNMYSAEVFHSRVADGSVSRTKRIQHIVAFGYQKNIVLVVGTNGRFYRCKFDPIVGGEMTQMECHNFLQPELMSTL